MTSASDDLRRAYSTLGLEPGVSPARARRRYRELAKRWHPDRHAGNAQDEAEAALQMRAINAAYERILEHQPGAATAAGRLPRPRLSREEIERYVSTIGSDGPVDAALELSRSFRRPFLIWLACVGVIAAVSPSLGMPLPAMAPLAVLLLLVVLLLRPRG